MTFYSSLAEAGAPLIAELGRDAELVSYGPDTLGPNGMTRGPETVQQVKLAFGKQKSSYSANGNATYKMRTAFISASAAPKVGDAVRLDGVDWKVTAAEAYSGSSEIVAYKVEIERA